MLETEQLLPAYEALAQQLAAVGVLRGQPQAQHRLDAARPWAALRWRDGESPCLEGASTRAKTLSLQAGQGQISLYLHPSAAAQLAGCSAQALCDRVLSLPAAWAGPPMTPAAVAGADPMLQALHALEKRLLARLPARLEVAPGFGLDLPAELEGLDFNLPIWRSRSGFSARTLQRRCLSHWGLPPLLLLRLLKARRAAEHLRAAAPVWRSLARGLGYADASHCADELRRFVGRVPSAPRLHLQHEKRQLQPAGRRAGVE